MAGGEAIRGIGMEYSRLRKPTTGVLYLSGIARKDEHAREPDS
jgi:hypothetical protein